MTDTSAIVSDDEAYEKYENLTAEQCKVEGNEHFKRKEWKEAVECYDAAIDKDPNVAIFYSNRSIAYIRLECYGFAYCDASKAIELDANFIKAYYRRAAALMSQAKFKEALKDFEYVMKKTKNNPEAVAKYNECRKVYMKQAFAKAIAVDKKKQSVADTLSLEMMTIDDHYDGPKLDNDESVTLEFIKEMMEYFRQEKLLHRRYAFKIILAVREIFMKAPTLVDITVPKGTKFTVCGDIHGQYYDLLNIFEKNGLPSETNPYLFNGDMVDRGSFSVECILLLFAFKVLYPKHLYLARGNHESNHMNSVFGFEGEVRAKYSQQMYELFGEVFEALPLAHLINKRIFVTHGGLFTKDDVSLDDIRRIDRFRQPPEDGLMCDLLWSDPMAAYGRAPSKRGVGIQFGPDVTKKFLDKNKLDYVIRSHEVKEAGWEKMHDGKLYTVFSAPNYCDQLGNLGAYFIFDNDEWEPTCVSFKEVPHPNKKPMCYSNSLFNFE